MKSHSSSKVLLVEDSEEDFITVKRAFAKAGIVNSIYRVETGDEALDYLNSEGRFANDKEVALPGLILLDLNLPGLDGREILKRVKSHASLKKIPIIVLTTSGDEKDIDECYREGANSYIQKPVEFKGFVEAMSRLKDYWFEISILPKPSED